MRNELNILPKLDHSNIIRLIDIGTFSIDEITIPLSFIVLPFIAEAKTLDKYLCSLELGENPVENVVLLDETLQNLVNLLHQWVDALKYIHDNKYVYLDVKPSNVIISKDGHLYVIDFGSTEYIDEEDHTSIMIYFSERYAYPRLKHNMRRSTSSNRVISAIKRSSLNYEFDYYALGQSILELLYILLKHHPHDFPQRPLYRSLHFLSTRLLNGLNSKKEREVNSIFPSEIYGGLNSEDYKTIKYEKLEDVLRDLEKEFGSWNLENVVPEIKTFPKDTIRMAPKINTVLTPRLRSIIEHPLFSRLKMVNQLGGLITLVYPTADHSRYDHILGSYSYTALYIKSLFYDSNNCIFRNLVDDEDIKGVLLASLLQGIGQYPLSYDLEEVNQKIFDHMSISVDLLSNPTKDAYGRTLSEIITDKKNGWGVDIEKLKLILGTHSTQITRAHLFGRRDIHDFKADMLSALIDGPIDSDKADYIIRDSSHCKIPYGDQLDIERLSNVLTTVRIPDHISTKSDNKVTIGVYEKGRASASAFSLARYLLYSSVYWHHTSRIIKAMIQYATVLLLPQKVSVPSSLDGEISEIRGKLINFIVNLAPPFENLYEENILLREQFLKISLEAQPTDDVFSKVLSDNGTSPMNNYWYPGISLTDWHMINWLGNLSNPENDDKRGLMLLNLILKRDLYKRVCTIPRNRANKDIIDKFSSLTWLRKIMVCEEIQRRFIELIKEKQPNLDTQPLTHIDAVQKINNENLAIIIDIPDPKKVFEFSRPLIFVPELERKTYYYEDMQPEEAENLTKALESLYISISPIRILVHPDLRQQMGACISQKDMHRIIQRVLYEV